MKHTDFNFGIDIGSTTTKVAATDFSGNVVFSDYRRHFGKIEESLKDSLNTFKTQAGNVKLSALITGSAGMGVSERLNIPFIQELIASAEYISRRHADVRTLIDIGGEDSKIIFFNEKSGADIRMNGSCAGGTGSFIDQMSNLMGLALEELDRIAIFSTKIYPVASRCGVFAKTDVQNLLSREVPKSDIAASIFSAVALQIKNSLLRGFEILPKVAFAGGPLSFLNALRKAVSRIFSIKEEDIIHTGSAKLLPALGASIASDIQRSDLSIDDFISLIDTAFTVNRNSESRITPLFSAGSDAKSWKSESRSIKVSRVTLKEISSEPCFLGIDSGSTTTKIVLVDSHGRLGFSHYTRNGISPVASVAEGLQILAKQAADDGADLQIAASAVTGYGEDLIKAAFGINSGFVETIAHWRAARHFDPEVSFILDIGGQDMKAIFIDNGIIRNIEINEACSSGCGSFIETFANSLNYTVSDFGEIACSAGAPCDLGTRCTVFMNSKVKQSFREGATAEDISAGLAYSVIYNCINKVLRLHDTSVMGDHVIVQGGAFKNPAVHRAFENIVGKPAVCPDISELMGAFGAALLASDADVSEYKHRKLSDYCGSGVFDVKYINCGACENNCSVSKLTFESGKVFFTGNRCEKIYTNKGEKRIKGANLPKIKYDLLFNRKTVPDSAPLFTVGIPRVLNIYENYPFWAAFFTGCGIKVHISKPTTDDTAMIGSGTVMSDNICYPAKLVHGHIEDLISSGVDRIFYPVVIYERQEIKGANNCFNCPVVSGYPDVIRSGMDPFGKHNIPLDSPSISFKDEKMLRKELWSYISQFGVDKKKFAKALKIAIEAQTEYKNIIKRIASEIIKKAETNGETYTIFAGRPYHIDMLINHGIPDIISDFGMDVITEDALTLDTQDISDNLMLAQWEYPNRLIAAAKWAGNRKFAEFIQINSFGCGPDTIVIDEVREILNSYGKNPTLIRIDEHTGSGSLKLRIRSLVESIRLTKEKTDLYDKYIIHSSGIQERITTKPFVKEDKDRTILISYFSPFHSGYISAPFKDMGYKVEILPPSDQDSIKYGLQYVNNEICYPATLVIGDIIRAFKSGKYDMDKVAAGISQTGGQCRASNYAPLLKKALVNAGFENVPVVSVSLTSKLPYNQPGFKIDKKGLILKGVVGILFGDSISAMYYAIAPREKVKGTAKKLADKYTELAFPGIESGNSKMLLKLLADAVRDFNSVELARQYAPKIGVVGEIYVKYNPKGNAYLVENLINEGIEVVLPPLINMFTQWFVNVNIRRDEQLEGGWLLNKTANLLEKYFDSMYYKFEKVKEDFKFDIRSHHIRHVAELAGEVMNLTNLYFGEGWLIAGDISAFAKDGIKNVLCLQPFGCIANHIIARGIEKSLKSKYDDLSILFLDIDSGTSEVNLQNRLHLLLKRAREQADTGAA